MNNNKQKNVRGGEVGRGNAGRVRGASAAFFSSMAFLALVVRSAIRSTFRFP